MKAKLIQLGLVALILAALTGCGVIPYERDLNKEMTQPEQSSHSQASFMLRGDHLVKTANAPVDCSPKKQRDVLVLLALSGGGSRSSLFSALSMYEMQSMKLNDSNLLSEVDLISAVSGGALPAAYYAISDDQPGSDLPRECPRTYSGRKWDKRTVIELMTKDYRDRGLANWIWPSNFLLYWFTTYNRSDIMAETLDSNLFTTLPSGRSIRFGDLNPARPNLVINATLASKDSSGEYSFGQPFTFTDEDFGRIGSSLSDYKLSRAVMASAAFPGAFNFMTLRNYRTPKGTKKYVHVFDGGNSDNLGLTSIKREIWLLYRSGELVQYRKIVVILVDAYTSSIGVDTNVTDPRHWYDYVVDTNIVTATDSLLARNRAEQLNEFETRYIFPYGRTEWEETSDPNMRQRRKQQASIACQRFFSWEGSDEAQKSCENTDWDDINGNVAKRLIFAHVGFQDVTDPDMRAQLNSIATDFTLSDNTDPKTGLTAAKAIECAVPTLVGSGTIATCGGKYRMSPEVAKRWKALLDEIQGAPAIPCPGSPLLTAQTTCPHE